jgi:penicillin-binding protein 1A
VFGADVAACEQNLLRAVVTGGTGTNAALGGQSAYGKTGTTDLRADAWFVGAAGNLATAVWFGNRTGNIPGAGFGGDSSAPVFRAFMGAALEGQPDRGIPAPTAPCTAPGQTVNPDGGRIATPPPPPVREPVEQPTVTPLPTPAPTAPAPPTAPPPTAAAAPVTSSPRPG